MSLRFISYGKKLDNLKITVDHRLIGSEFATFKEKVKKNDTLILVADSKVWGTAVVCSEVEVDHSVRIWADKPYPYRAKISNVFLFKNPFHFEKYQLNDDFRELYGKGWAFKFLFTPGDIPKSIEKKLEEILGDQVCIPENEQSSYLEKLSNESKKARRLKLGLTSVE